MTTILVALFLLASLRPDVAASQSLLINEVMSSNGATIADEDGDHSDWIEVLNSGNTSISLLGVGLSDDQDRPFRWTFPDISLPAGDRLIIWASGKDRTGTHLHASFSLSQDGEPVLLTSASGDLLDRVDVPALPRDVSYGRSPDGGDSWRYFTEPSPGEPNAGDQFAGFLQPPILSVAPGFHSSEFQLEMVAEPGATIHYTLDGSEPTAETPVYEGPIHIRDRRSDPNELSIIPTSHTFHSWAPPLGTVYKGTVVRAIAVRDDALPSDVSTASYFIDPSLHDRYSFPVISISTDFVHLFSGETGLFVPGDEFERQIANRTPTTNIEREYANYGDRDRTRGEEWERPIHFEMFVDGASVVSQEAGMRIHGGLSRLYRQKSLRLYARGRYGESEFQAPFFDEKPGMISRRIILRSSGQDWTKTMFRDVFMQRLSRHMDIDYQAYQPAVVFINGEFWGIHNIRERIDQHYIASNYGVDPDRVDLLTSSGVASAGSNAAFLSLRSYVVQNDPANRQVYEQVAAQMDIDNFIDYHIAQIFIRNNDWPHNNIDYWRAQPGAAGDSRWRWILYDTDFGFGWSADPWDRDMIAWARHENGNGHGSWATTLFRRLLRNSDFRNQFINRLQDQLNTAYRPAHVIGLIDEFERLIEPEIGGHIHRWGWRGDHSSFHQTPANVTEWKANVEVLRDFARRRPGYVRTHLRTNFSLNPAVTLTVDVASTGSGHVEVNSIHVREETEGVDADPYPWQGSYHGQIPVRLVPHAAPGYRFVEWTGTERTSADTLYVTSSSASSYVANFAADEEWLDGAFPRAHDLSGSDYRMPGWAPTSEPGTFPESMAFYYMDEDDPSLEAMPEAPTAGVYDLESRTRIVGLGDGGVGFINTGNEDGNPGYPGRRLGAAVLALDTRDRTDIVVSWTGGTVIPNVRNYALRLQYRLGDEGPLQDLLDENGEPVEYVRSEQSGHSLSIGPTMLPRHLDNRPYVQLWWRYYFTGDREEADGGARDMLRLADVNVSSRTSVSAEIPSAPDRMLLRPAYPNPFTELVTIPVDIERTTHVSVTIHDMLGRTVGTVYEGSLSTGQHRLTWEPGANASGVYLVRFSAAGTSQSRTITLIR